MQLKKNINGDYNEAPDALNIRKGRIGLKFQMQ